MAHILGVLSTWGNLHGGGHGNGSFRRQRRLAAGHHHQPYRVAHEEWDLLQHYSDYWVELLAVQCAQKEVYTVFWGQ